MENIFLVIILLLSFLTLAPAKEAPSADKVIDQYKKSSNAGAARQIRSTLMTGSAMTADGTTGSFSLQTENPDRMRIDIEVGNTKVSECYNGNSAWRQDSNGFHTLTGDGSKSIKLYSLLTNTRLQDLSRHRIFVKSEGTARIEDREANVLDFALNGIHAKLFFDLQTRLPIKQERVTAEGREELFYSDYRSVDGVRDEI